MLLTNLFQNLFRHPAPVFQQRLSPMSNPFKLGPPKPQQRSLGDVNIQSQRQFVKPQNFDPKFTHFYDWTAPTNDSRSQFYNHAQNFNKTKPGKPPITLN